LQAQKTALLEKHCKERYNGNNSNCDFAPENWQANLHHIEEQVNLDTLIDYTIMSHKGNTTNHNGEEDGDNDDTLLAYMAGRNASDASDIRHVLAANHTQNKKETTSQCE
jgi:hypothetical protein